jgi:hypothetical protein
LTAPWCHNCKNIAPPASWTPATHARQASRVSGEIRANVGFFVALG